MENYRIIFSWKLRSENGRRIFRNASLSCAIVAPRSRSNPRSHSVSHHSNERAECKRYASSLSDMCHIRVLCTEDRNAFFVCTSRRASDIHFWVSNERNGFHSYVRQRCEERIRVRRMTLRVLFLPLLTIHLIEWSDQYRSDCRWFVSIDRNEPEDLVSPLSIFQQFDLEYECISFPSLI